MSDSTPEFRASQSAHAQEVRAVHILTKTLGCTRSQAIAAIRLQEAQRTLPANANAGNKIGNLFQEPPKIKRTEVPIQEIRHIEPVIPEPLLVPPAIPFDGTWVTVGLCLDGVSGFRQVLTRPVP